MSWIDSKELFLLYLKFFNRKILNMGVLKGKYTKIIVLIAFGILFIGMSGLAYVFFDSMIQLEKNYLLIVNFYALTAFVYSILAFGFIKVLFATSSELLGITKQLPVSNKSRKLSLLLLEFSLVSLLVTSVVSPLMLGFILKTNSKYIMGIVTNIFFVSLTAYNLFNVFYHFLFYCLDKIKAKVSQYFMSIFLVSVFLLWGLREYGVWGEYLITDYYGGYSPPIPPLFYDYLAKNYSFAYSLFSFLLINALLVFLTIFFSSNQAIENQKYFSIHTIKGKKFDLWQAYFLRPFRRKDNYLLFIVCLIGFLFGIYSKIADSQTIFLFLTFNAIYSIAQSEKLHIFYKRSGEYSAIKEYFWLLGSNILYVFAMSFPFLLFGITNWSGFSEVFTFLIMVITFCVYLMMIGIFFPPIFDNPISITMGMVITGVFGGLIALLFLFLNVSVFIQILLLGSSIFVMMGVSIHCLGNYEGSGS